MCENEGGSKQCIDQTAQILKEKATEATLLLQFLQQHEPQKTHFEDDLTYQLFSKMQTIHSTRITKLQNMLHGALHSLAVYATIKEEKTNELSMRINETAERMEAEQAKKQKHELENGDQQSQIIETIEKHFNQPNGGNTRIKETEAERNKRFVKDAKFIHLMTNAVKNKCENANAPSTSANQEIQHANPMLNFFSEVTQLSLLDTLQLAKLLSSALRGLDAIEHVIKKNDSRYRSVVMRLGALQSYLFKMHAMISIKENYGFLVDLLKKAETNYAQAETELNEFEDSLVSSNAQTDNFCIAVRAIIQQTKLDTALKNVVSDNTKIQHSINQKRKKQLDLLYEQFNEKWKNTEFPPDNHSMFSGPFFFMCLQHLSKLIDAKSITDYNNNGKQRDSSSPAFKQPQPPEELNAKNMSQLAQERVEAERFEFFEKLVSNMNLC